MNARSRVLVRRVWVVAAGMAVAAAGSAQAHTYRPNKTGDHAPDECNKFDCTLREAVIAADTRIGADRIVLKQGKVYKLSVAGEEDFSEAGDLDIDGGTLTVESNGKRQATVDANHLDGGFEIAADNEPTTARLRRLRIVHADSGAGVSVESGGSLWLTNSTLTRNLSSGLRLGGGRATVTGSTIDHNQAPLFGGGIAVIGGHLTASNTTITGNVATGVAAIVGGNGGGVYFNSAAASGGKLSNVTIARNTARTAGSSGYGGGIAVAGPDGDKVTVRNTIIALNKADVGPDCAAGDDRPATSEGHNLLGAAAGCKGLQDSPNLFRPNPRLGSLKSNGGPTKTIALLKGSKAINNAGAKATKRDQRGHKRHNPDIGAFERG